MEHILFIDIETVSQYENYEAVPEKYQSIWEKKYTKNDYLNSLPIEESYREKAAIFAEYGKVVCISIAYYHLSQDELRIKSFYSNDEKKLLGEFHDFCLHLKKNYIFCGHNIKEFDIPYLCRRFLINGFAIPPILNFQSKKPWEIEMIDTLQLWGCAHLLTRFQRKADCTSY